MVGRRPNPPPLMASCRWRGCKNPGCADTNEGRTGTHTHTHARAPARARAHAHPHAHTGRGSNATTDTREPLVRFSEAVLASIKQRVWSGPGIAQRVRWCACVRACVRHEAPSAHLARHTACLVFLCRHGNAGLEHPVQRGVDCRRDGQHNLGLQCARVHAAVGAGACRGGWGRQCVVGVVVVARGGGGACGCWKGGWSW